MGARTRVMVMVLSAVLSVTACSAPAADAPPPSEITEAEVAALFERYVAAWNASDAEAFGELFTDDAEQVVWNGFRMQGHDELVQGHADLFADGASMMRVNIESIRYPAPGVATVLVSASRSFDGGEPPKEPMAMPFFVLVREAGEPRIASLHNMMLPSAWPMIMGGPPQAEDN